MDDTTRLELIKSLRAAGLAPRLCLLAKSGDECFDEHGRFSATKACKVLNVNRTELTELFAKWRLLYSM